MRETTEPSTTLSSDTLVDSALFINSCCVGGPKMLLHMASLSCPRVCPFGSLSPCLVYHSIHYLAGMPLFCRHELMTWPSSAASMAKIEEIAPWSKNCQCRLDPAPQPSPHKWQRRRVGSWCCSQAKSLHAMGVDLNHLLATHASLLS